MQRTIEIELPMPPSVNEVYRVATQKRLGRFNASNRAYMYKNAKAQDYQMIVNNKFKIKNITGFPFSDRIFLEIYLYPNSKKHFDIDNRCKLLLDCLEFSKAFENDNQIDKLYVERMEVIKEQKCIVKIRNIIPNAIY